MTISRPRGSIEERFWAKVDRGSPDECWAWQANLGKDGYGLFRIGVGRQARAHRLSWELRFGAIPTGLFVLHRCDNPRCVNPAHLFLGDHATNMRDMVAKGRSAAVRNPEVYREISRRNAKLNEEQVSEIRRRAAEGENYISIAHDFPVGKSMIGNIVRGEAWVT